MRDDFDELVERRGTGSYKWDVEGEADVVQLWVADMDFAVAPEIAAAVRRRAEHPVYGYTRVGDSFYDAIIGWHGRRDGAVVRRESVLYTTGVVPAVSAILKGLGARGVVTLTPAYNCFFSSIRNNGCQLLDCRLRRGASGYEVDWEEFERLCSLEEADIFLLCNPHNPTGRLWTRAELSRMVEICRAHGVRVVADEIHSGIIRPGAKFVSCLTLGEDIVVTSSCSKSFNTAGLCVSYIIACDEPTRASIDRAININEVCDVNPFGVVALVAAFDKCEYWLGEMAAYVWGNYDYLCDYVARHLPELCVMPMEATYLAWVDCRSLGLSSAEVASLLLRRGRVRVSPGEIYGATECFVRINLATSRATLAEGLRRIREVIKE